MTSPKFPCKQIPTDYVPEKQVSVGEGMNVSKGQLIFKVYVPDKPDRYSVKAYLVSECNSGYIYRVIQTDFLGFNNLSYTVHLI